MTKTLKPAAGLKVRKPDGQHLKAAGENVELTSYWQRRIIAGDVIETDAAAADPKIKGGK